MTDRQHDDDGPDPELLPFDDAVAEPISDADMLTDAEMSTTADGDDHPAARSASGAHGGAELVATPMSRAERRRAGRRRRPWLMAAAALVAIVAIVAGTLVALTKTITVVVDGEAMTVTTLAGSVDGALDAAGVQVGEHDTLAPAVDADIADGASIVLNRGRLFRLTVDGADQQIWTTARTVDAALAEIGRNPSDYRLSADRSRAIPLDGLEITADTLHAVTLANGGDRRTVDSVGMTVAAFLASQDVVLAPNQEVSPVPASVILGDTVITITTLPTVSVTDGTSAAIAIISKDATVGDLLASAGVVLGPQDVVSVGLDPVGLDAALTDGLALTITRINTSQVTGTVALDQPADESVKDSTMNKGTSEVTQQGRPGEAQVTYDVVLTNGVETARTEVARTVTIEPLPTITAVGSKVVVVVPTTPPPADTPTDPSTPPPADATTPPPSGGVTWDGNRVYFNDFEYGVNWDGLAKCESGNNPRAINPSGKYTGLFQFDDRTWQGVGGSGRAYDATPEEQLMRAKLLYQSRGLQPWECAYAAR